MSMPHMSNENIKCYVIIKKWELLQCSYPLIYAHMHYSVHVKIANSLCVCLQVKISIRAMNVVRLRLPCVVCPSLLLLFRRSLCGEFLLDPLGTSHPFLTYVLSLSGVEGLLGWFHEWERSAECTRMRSSCKISSRAVIHGPKKYVR